MPGDNRRVDFWKRRYGIMETCVVLMTVLAVGFVLSKAAQVAIPFLLAFLLSFLLSPIVRLAKPYKIPPIVVVLVILVALVAICLPLGIFLNSRLQGMMLILPGYYNKLVRIGQSVLQQVNIPVDFWDSINWYNTVGRYLSGMTGFMLHWLASLMMVLVFLVFMLLESPYVENRLRLAFVGNGQKVWEISHKISTQISKYLRTLAIISLATGLCVWCALWLIGVDFALTWGVLAFFLNFIPTIGSIVASIPPVLIALVQYYPDWVPSVVTLFSLLMIQFTIGNLMTPKIMGDALDLSPVLILISLLFWSLIWGFSGALLSVPIAVMIKIICENILRLNFVAILMSSTRTTPEAACGEKQE